MRVVEEDMENDLYDIEKIVLVVVPLIFLCVSFLASRFLLKKRGSFPSGESEHHHTD